MKNRASPAMSCLHSELARHTANDTPWWRSKPAERAKRLIQVPCASDERDRMILILTVHLSAVVVWLLATAASFVVFAYPLARRAHYRH